MTAQTHTTPRHTRISAAPATILTILWAGVGILGLLLAAITINLITQNANEQNTIIAGGLAALTLGCTTLAIAWLRKNTQKTHNKAAYLSIAYGATIPAILAWIGQQDDAPGMILIAAAVATLAIAGLWHIVDTQRATPGREKKKHANHE